MNSVRLVWVYSTGPKVFHFCYQLDAEKCFATLITRRQSPFLPFRPSGSQFTSALCVTTVAAGAAEQVSTERRVHLFIIEARRCAMCMSFAVDAFLIEIVEHEKYAHIQTVNECVAAAYTGEHTIRIKSQFAPTPAALSRVPHMFAEQLNAVYRIYWILSA